MKEFGPEFLEKSLQKCTMIEMREIGLEIYLEQCFDVIFRDKIIGRYHADLVVRKLCLEIKML
jgi:hypothetical protein